MLCGVHEADRTVWLAIDRGDRAVDWEAWLGHPDGAVYLTEAGKQVAERIKKDMTIFFGPKWLPAAVGPDRAGQRPAIPELGAVSPVLAPQGPTGAYAEAVRWWASLQLLSERGVPGRGLVQRQTRTNIQRDRLLHTLTQARLSAIGMFLGATVVLEPEKAGGGPGDVLLQAGDAEVFLEVMTLGADVTFLQRDSRFHDNFLHLRGLEDEYDVHFVGDVPGSLPSYKLNTWLRETAETAAQCAHTSIPVEIPGEDGRCLTVRPGPPPPGTTLSAPHIERDQGRRLLDAIRKKASQTAGAGIAWIWAEDLGGLYPFTPFAGGPLASKVELLAELTEQVYADHAHVGGIVLSHVTRHSAPPKDEAIERASGYGFRRRLPLDHVREILIIPGRTILPNQIHLLARICDEEAHWLDWALGQLGVPTDLTGLLQKPRLWESTRNVHD